MWCGVEKHAIKELKKNISENNSKKITKPLSSNINADCRESLDILKELLDNNTDDGIKLRKLIEDCIYAYFEDKILSVTGLIFKESFYFNKKELLENNTVTATKENSNLNIKDTMFIRGFINNLDSFDIELRSYCCENNINIHKGIIISDKLYDNDLAFLVVTLIDDEEKLKIDIYKGLEDIPLIDELIIHENKSEIIYRLKNYVKVYNYIKNKKLNSFEKKSVKYYSEDFSIDMIDGYNMFNSLISDITHLKKIDYKINEVIELLNSLEPILADKGFKEFKDELFKQLKNKEIYPGAMWGCIKYYGDYINEDVYKVLKEHNEKFLERHKSCKD